MANWLEKKLTLIAEGKSSSDGPPLATSGTIVQRTRDLPHSTVTWHNERDAGRSTVETVRRMNPSRSTVETVRRMNPNRCRGNKTIEKFSY